MYCEFKINAKKFTEKWKKNLLCFFFFYQIIASKLKEKKPTKSEIQRVSSRRTHSQEKKNDFKPLISILCDIISLFTDEEP